MIEHTAKPSVSRLAIALGINRNSVYYKPRPVSDADLKLMRQIDRVQVEFPFAGIWTLQGLPVQEGSEVGPLASADLV